MDGILWYMVAANQNKVIIWAPKKNKVLEKGMLMSIPQCIIFEIPDTLSQW